MTSFAQTLKQVLKQCGDNLTRENIMKLAASPKDFRVGLRPSNSRINTGSAEYRVAADMRSQARGEGGMVRAPFVPQASRDKLTPCGDAADQHLP